MRASARRLAAALGALGTSGLLAMGCGGSHSAGTLNTAVAGQLANGALPSGGGASGGSSTTVPLAKQSTITALFTAIGSFQSCLKGLGVTFIGIPDASNPNSPANDPTYIKNLTTCAAQSNILQALKAAQDAQSNLTLAQIKTENKQYLKWRTCMIGKGWGIPTPTPNAQGLLFSFGGSGTSAGGSAGGGGGTDLTGIKPPPGKTLFSTSDMEACASQATS